MSTETRKTAALSERDSEHSKGRTVRDGLCWGSGMMATILMMTLFTTYISFYATNVIGMRAKTIGIVLLITKLFDGVTDLIAGFIIDNTHTRLGKARPYEWAIPFGAIFAILCFATPNASEPMQAVWIGVTYVLVWAVCYTLRSAAEPVYLLRAFPDEKYRNSVFSLATIISQGIGLALGVVLPLLVAQAGTSRSGWVRLAVIATVPFAAVAMIRFFTVPEVVKDDVTVKKESKEEQKKEKVSVKDGLRAVFTNKYILLLTLAIFIIVICSGLLNTSMAYYFQYFVGDQKKMSIASLAFSGMLVMLVAFNPLATKFGKANVMKVCLLVSAVGCFIRWFGGVNILTIFIGNALMMMGVTPMAIYFPLYLFDIMDYGEWKSGKRVEGVIAVFPGFANKVAGGLSVSIGAFILDAAGYDGKLAVQSAQAMNAIELCFNILPAVLLAITAVIMILFYNIDKYMPQVKTDLAARKAAEAGQQPKEEGGNQ